MEFEDFSAFVGAGGGAKPRYAPIADHSYMSGRIDNTTWRACSANHTMRVRITLDTEILGGRLESPGCILPHTFSFQLEEQADILEVTPIELTVVMEPERDEWSHRELATR